MSYQRLLLVLAESDKDPTDTLLEWVFAAGLLAELLPDPGLRTPLRNCTPSLQVQRSSLRFRTATLDPATAVRPYSRT